jgi:hypothetical protein
LTCTNPETRPSYHSLTKQSFFAVKPDTPWLMISLLHEASQSSCVASTLLRHAIRQSRRTFCLSRWCAALLLRSTQYAAGYDTFETVLFLETMATTFCRLRPEALPRHSMPLQLRLLPTTMEVSFMMLWVFSADVFATTRASRQSQ